MQANKACDKASNRMEPSQLLFVPLLSLPNKAFNRFELSRRGDATDHGATTPQITDDVSRPTGTNRSNLFLFISKVIKDVSWCLGRAWFNLVTIATFLTTRKMLALILVSLLLGGGLWWRPAEQSLPQLWERVEAGGRRARQLWEEASHRDQRQQEYGEKEASYLAGLERVLVHVLLNMQETVSGQVTAQVRQELSGLVQQMTLKAEATASQDTAGGAGITAMTLEEVNLIVSNVVSNALRVHSRDRTGMADYALESAGGTIVATRCSETYTDHAAVVHWYGIIFHKNIRSPRTVIQPDVHPGNCWPFKGSRGSVAINLSKRIIPRAFSLEHVPKALTLNGMIDSAPKDFQVFGLDHDSQENGTLLGSYTYQEDGDDLQTYAVPEENQQRAFQIIEVRVLSNWGHEDFTCMYRFRVHGTPIDS